MAALNVLTVNLVFSTVVFAIAARIYVMPRLREGTRAVLVPILLLHAMRHLGLMFLSPGGTYAGIPMEFARPAAFGDLTAALLALGALAAVLKESSAARPLLWVFNVEGTLDLGTPSTWPTSTPPSPTWDPPTGSPPSGSQRCWSPITSSS